MRAGKGFSLLISNENMNDIIKITKSLEYSGALIDGGWISWSFVSTFNRFISRTSGFVSSTRYKRNYKRRAGRGYMNKIF